MIISTFAALADLILSFLFIQAGILFLVYSRYDKQWLTRMLGAYCIINAFWFTQFDITQYGLRVEVMDTGQLIIQSVLVIVICILLINRIKEKDGVK